MSIKGFASFIGLAILALASHPGCGGSRESCESRHSTFCFEGRTYWADSCGEIQELKESCPCGCKPDNSECQDCDCGACVTPPPDSCKDADTLTTWPVPGTCVEGECQYSPVEEFCPLGCDGSTDSCRECHDACPGAGQTECLSGSIRTCRAGASGCLEWSEYHECPDGFCADGSSCGECQDECSSPGQNRCSNASMYTCQADSHGCLIWGPGTPCPDPFCENTDTCGVCEHFCATVSATWCLEAILYVCRVDQRGCRFWELELQCPEGFCADSESCGNCDNQCLSAGSTGCLDGKIRTCEADQNGCLSWSNYVDCPEGFCADTENCGSCNDQCEFVGQAGCMNGSMYSCESDAHGCLAWGSQVECPDGFCASPTECGVCEHECDEYGVLACTNGQINQCAHDANGCRIWSHQDDCRTHLCADSSSCRDWGVAEQLESGDQGRNINTQVAVDSQGNAWAVWLKDGGFGDDVWTSSYIPGTGWNAPALLSDENEHSKLPKIIVLGDGNAIAVWAQGVHPNMNVMARSYQAASGWGPLEEIAWTGADLAGTEVKAASSKWGNGQAVAVWDEESTSGERIWSNFYSPGTGWGDPLPVTIEGTAGFIFPLEVAMDSQGNVICVWDEGHIFASRYNADSGWSSAFRLDDENSAGSFPQITMDGLDNAWVIWRHQSEIWVTRFSQVWEQPERLYTNGQLPYIAADVQGNVTAVWSLENSVSAMSYDVDSGWGNRYTISSRYDLVGWVSLAMNDSGNAVVIWEQENSQDSFDVWANNRVDGHGWSDAARIETSSATVYCPHVGFDVQNRATAVWIQDFGVWANRLE